MAQRFTLAIGDNARVARSQDEVGIVIARAQYRDDGNQYLLQYQNAQGVGVEQWWRQNALVKVEG